MKTQRKAKPTKLKTQTKKSPEPKPTKKTRGRKRKLPDSEEKLEEKHQDIMDKLDKKSKTNVPDVLYTEDGTIFYPCKNCCRAFANKADLIKHSIFCLNPITYQLSNEVLPLTSVENTMNVKQNESNNNQKKQVLTPLNPVETKIKAKEEKLLKVNCIPNGINTFDLKTKAKIVKYLNNTLENNGFSVVVMGNGDVVTKMHAMHDLPPLEFTSRVVSIQNEREIQISLKHSTDKSADKKLPEVTEVLDKLFGPDEFITSLINATKSEVQNQIKPESEVITSDTDTVMQVDEHEHEEIATDDEQLLGEMDGPLVLEEFDIHICKQCGSVYHTLEDLVQHDKYDHRKIKKKYSLDEVEKFGLVFMNNKNHECPICLKKLKGKGCWPRHAQSHSEIGMFECKVCKKRFTRDDHRKNHESRHVIQLD